MVGPDESFSLTLHLPFFRTDTSVEKLAVKPTPSPRPNKKMGFGNIFAGGKPKLKPRGTYVLEK